MKELLKFLRGHKADSITAPLFKMLEAFFDLLIPLITAQMINTGIANGDRHYIVTRTVILVSMGFVGLVCSISAQYFAARAAVDSCAEIRHDLFDRIQTLGFSGSDRFGTGALITRLTTDVNQVQNGLNYFLRLLLRSPFVVLGSVILAFTIDVRGALIFTVAVPVLCVIIVLIMKKTVPGFLKVQSLLDRLSGIAQEDLTGQRVVRAFGREDTETARFEGVNSDMVRDQVRVGSVSALLNPLTFSVINIAIAAIIFVSGKNVYFGRFAVGSAVALCSYMNQILLELMKIMNLVVMITKAVAASERINKVLAGRPDLSFGSETPDVSASDTAVEFRDVVMRYPSGEADSLTGVSFSVRRGETVGIIGGTGSGKTTLVSLIPRYYDVSSGSIKVFGRDVREYSREGLRRCVITVMQKTRLFSGTIRSNLLWGNESASDADLLAAVKAAQASDVIASKALGLDEPVEQNGDNLSGGQKQRLSIARALAARPAVLILDDSSSALDYATDAALRRSLRDVASSMTVFIVSQRAASVMDADKILVLDEGRLVDAGTHSQLIARCDIYRDICNSQLQAAGGQNNE